MGRIIAIKEDGKTPSIPITEWTGLNMGFEFFNPLQSRFVLEGLHREDVNVLCTWPTSAGKTVVAELVTENTLLQRRKAIYACPLKSLAEEKIRRFTRLFPDKKIEIFTGDYRDVENRQERARRADIAIVTTELLDSVALKSLAALTAPMPGRNSP